MGTAPEGEALQALVDVATLELYRIQEKAQPSLFPAEASANEILAARRRKQADQPLPIEDARALEETRRVCVGFHEVFGALYDRLGLADLFTPRQTMARRLFRQAVLLRLATANGPTPGTCPWKTA